MLQDINFQFIENKSYFLFGRTGIGKSLLLDSIAGLYKNYSGEIKSLKQNQVQSYLFQKNALVPWLTVRENLKLVCSIDSKIFEGYLEKFDLLSILNKKAALLSGGEIQVVNLIRGLILKPKVIFSDEPFSSIDHVTKLKAYQILKEYLAENLTTLIAVSHDLEEICLMADEVLFFDHLKKGLVTSLPKEKISIKNLYGLLSGVELDI